MLIRIPAASLRVCRPFACRSFAMGLLALGASACVTTPPAEAPAPAPQPATAAPAAPAPAPAPPPPPEPPSVAPAPASVPGRLKLALVSSWLWADGEYVSPLEKLDYVALLARLRAHRAAGGDSAEAKTFELEVDAATDWQTVRSVLGLCDGYERFELITGAGRFSLHMGGVGGSATPDGAKSHRTVVLLRSDGITVWAGQEVIADAADGSAAKPEKLLEAPWTSSDGELEAEYRGACSNDPRCSRVFIYLEEDLPGPQLLRVLGLINRSAGATPPAISLSLAWPPLPGEEATAFTTQPSSSGAPLSGNPAMIALAKGGRLAPEVIRQVVRSSYAVFRGCYERGLATNSKLEGRVTVRFVIQGDGSVSDASNGGSDLPSDEVVQCVIQGFLGIRFPAPWGGIVTVQYPIMLQPG
jgi:hypothetical protein